MDTHPWILDDLGKDEVGKASDTGIGCHHSQHSHISHQTGSPTARPQSGLRSQFIYPNFSRFIPIFPLSNNTLSPPAFPWHGLSAPGAFPSPIPGEIRGWSLCQRLCHEQRSAGFLGAALARLRQRRNPRIWGAREQLPPSIRRWFFPPAAGFRE